MTQPTGEQPNSQEYTIPLIVAGVISIVIVLILGGLQQCNINSLQDRIEAITKEIQKKEEVQKNDNKKSIFTPQDQTRLLKDILTIEKDKTVIQNAAYTNIIQAIGGIVVGFTAFVGYLNFQATLAKQAQEKEIANQNLQATQNQKLKEQYSQENDKLGADSIEVRISGIKILETIAFDSPEKYHWKVMERLSDFIRSKCSGESQANPNSGIETPPDIKMALTVIGRRNVSKDPPDSHIDLSNVNLSNVNLEQANFRNANFHNAKFFSPNLREADLSSADLGGAIFSGSIILRRAKLKRTNLEGTDLASASMDDADLSGAKCHEATLNNAVFRGVDLREADLSKAKLRNVNLSTCKDKNLTNINLSEADLTDADLRGVDLSGSKLSGAIFNCANLTDVDLLTCPSLTQEQLKSAIRD
jgi:uncharacterized protein YjbI with pentapeptide repeats